MGTRHRVHGWARAGVLATAMVLGSAVGVPGVAQSPIRAMEEAAQRYREIHSLCADFEQVLEVPLLRRTVESAGHLCQQRPNLFSMRFTDPAGDMVISDGDHFWVYYPSLNEEQVMRYAVATSPGRYNDFFQEFLENPGTKYAASEAGTEDIGGKTCTVVDLTPLGDVAYRRARLWLDPETDLICRVEVHQENGSVRTVTLTSLDLNPLLGSDVFAFVVPEGARIVDPSR